MTPARVAVRNGDRLERDDEGGEMLYLTSDLHLDHANIIRLADRPFSGVEEMNRELIAAINDRVSFSDELWVLGDLIGRATHSRLRELRGRIVCRHVHLIRGNHDPFMQPGQAVGIYETDEAYNDRLRSPQGRRMVLCHYPIADWNGQRRGSYMLHGHIHSQGAAYNEAQRARGILRYDVGVDANGYAPVSVAEVEAWFDGVEPTPVHHAEGDGGGLS